MPIITGRINREGAAVDVLLGPPSIQLQVQKGHPKSVALRAVLDTGAAVTGVARHLLESLGLIPFDSIPIRVPVGPPQSADRYRVRIGFVSGMTAVDFADVVVIATDCFYAGEDLQALIGRDLLNQCSFQYWGTTQEFQFAY